MLTFVVDLGPGLSAAFAYRLQPSLSEVGVYLPASRELES